MLKQCLTALLLAASLGVSPSLAQMPKSAVPVTKVSTWQIDPAHSELTFRIRHLVSRVQGTFNEWGGTLVGNPENLAGGSVEVAIKTTSIDTNNERRDDHLRSADFFDAATYPTITFRSRKVDLQDKKIRVTGDLAMHGVTKPVVLDGQLTGLGLDARGKQRIGFEASTTINRHDFGVKWNRAAEGGGVVLGDDVEIAIVVAAVQQ